MIIEKAIARRPLTESLAPRLAIEQEFARTGKNFRRHPDRGEFEDVLVRPLRSILRIAGIYSRGMRKAACPIIRELTLSVASLPPAFDGYRIVHLSDLHLDSVPGLAENAAEIMHGFDIGLVLITGDYRFLTAGPCQYVYSGMRKILSGVTARDGIFGILGNHDSSEMAEPLEELGVQMLINDAVPIRRGSERIWLAGVDDSYDYRTDDLARAMEFVPSSACRILMAHTPDLYRDASEAGIDLYFCGHTHAGQVRLPFIGSIIQNSDAPRKYTHGYWQHGRMHGYTSAGLGCSLLPIRFNCPPEIVVITLRGRSVAR